MLKRIVRYLLLASLIFNTTHAFLLDSDKPHIVQEYVQEIEHACTQNSCDGHCLLHMPLLPNSLQIIIETSQKAAKVELPLLFWPQSHTISLFKPPKNL